MDEQICRGQDPVGLDEIDPISTAGEARIKKIEQIKVMQTLSELEHRELVEQCGRIFTAGMGAEAVRELVERVDLDQLAAQLRGRDSLLFRAEAKEGHQEAPSRRVVPQVGEPAGVDDT